MDRAYQTPHLGRAALIATLALPVLLFGLSMPLAWHHLMLEQPVGAIRVINGIDGASWLIVIAVVALYLLVRVLLKRAGFYTKWLMTLTSLVLVIGMFADYIDWQSRASQIQGLDYKPAYFGPGFFVALAGAALFITANVLLWRVDLD